MKKYPTSIFNKRNTSGMTGVSFDKRMDKWVVCISLNGKQKTIGRFKSKEEAISCREKAEDLR